MSAPPPRILLAFHWYSEALHEGALRYALERGWLTRVLNADSVAELEPSACDGILGMLPPPEHPVHRFAQATRAPVVELSLSYPENGRWCRCPSDGDAVGRLAADHLRLRPVASFLFVARDLTPTHAARAAGFSAGLAGDARPRETFLCGDDDESSAVARLAESLRRLPRPVGIFGSVDASARLALDAANRAGLKVPGDACILGFGNRDLVAALAPVPLSSIAIDYRAWGYAAAKLLDERMAGKIPEGACLAFPPVELVVRASTAGETAPHPLCERALAILRLRVRNPPSVDELARLVGVSRSTLNRAFTDAFGRGVAAKGLALRMEVARGLLAAGEKVESVAAGVGFASPRAFRAAFRKTAGCAPGEYPARPTRHRA